MTFRLGCAVWSYGWVGDLFPAGSRSRDFLSLYSRRLTTVEGNTTFYAVPDANTVQRWRSETPDGFEFCLKLPRDITHRGRLDRALPEALRFYERMQPLGDRLGPMFLQLPPTYAPAQFDDLAAFLQQLTQQLTQQWQHPIRLAIEVRHPAWFTAPHSDRLDRLLRELQIGRVLLDSRPIYQEATTDFERRKPNLPLVPSLTADFCLIRFVSHPDRDKNQAMLADWATRLQGWLPQTQIYFCVHCPIEARSPANVRLVQQVFEHHNLAIPPLPWNQLDEPAQLDLF